VATTIASFHKALRNARANLPSLPWPIPERPQVISVCASASANYTVVVAVEAWDKADPRAVISFRCQRQTVGQAFADTLLLQRVPLAGLSQGQAEAIFTRLVVWVQSRAESESLLAPQKRAKGRGASEPRVRAETATRLPVSFQRRV
jgi:hypothetical protein